MSFRVKPDLRRFQGIPILILPLLQSHCPVFKPFRASIIRLSRILFVFSCILFAFRLISCRLMNTQNSRHNYRKYILASLFLFSNSHCMQFARLCNCPQSIKLLEIMPQNIKLLVKSARFATESLYSQNKKPSTRIGERRILLQRFMPALLLLSFRCTRRRPYLPPHPSTGTGS